MPLAPLPCFLSSHGLRPPESDPSAPTPQASSERGRFHKRHVPWSRRRRSAPHVNSGQHLYLRIPKIGLLDHATVAQVGELLQLLGGTGLVCSSRALHLLTGHLTDPETVDETIMPPYR